MNHDRNGWVVSDLHLFAGRSDGARSFEAWLKEASLSGIDVLVLNGDTFDFRWSTLGSEQQTIDRAIEWMDRLTQRLTDQTIHFLLGNHDCLTSFVTRMKEWVESQENVFVHDHRLQIGNSLFLHGDVANKRMGLDALVKLRADWAVDHPKGSFSRQLYRMADLSGLSRAFHHAYFPPALTIKRIAYHLDEAVPDWRDDIKTVYFGHTHCPIHGYELDGVQFYNTGSGIRGMGFAPQQFEC